MGSVFVNQWLVILLIFWLSLHAPPVLTRVLGYPGFPVSALTSSSPYPGHPRPQPFHLLSAASLPDFSFSSPPPPHSLHSFYFLWHPYEFLLSIFISSNSFLIEMYEFLSRWECFLIPGKRSVMHSHHCYHPWAFLHLWRLNPRFCTCCENTQSPNCFPCLYSWTFLNETMF